MNSRYLFGLILFAFSIISVSADPKIIGLNCLVIPRKLHPSFSNQSVITIEISNDKNVSFLKDRIRDEWANLLGSHLPYEIVLRKIEDTSNNLLSAYNFEGKEEGIEMSPVNPIYHYFPNQPYKKDVHVVLYFDVKHDEL
ncbi:hypothetical protein C1645_739367 [Glomus cerebriforme]|uniref:Crinkler effector protein N-terminal domain-containing protein n=1 Tax=Glomus cerebriforme TaxID=658196 RepID=A0A397SS15_9GLOM|nr:hypothetical protein C1645_739367 [Glomus cerebriforme]